MKDIRKYYSQLVAIRESLEDSRDEYEDDEDETFEALDSAVENLGLTIEDLEEILPDNGANITFVLE